VEVNRAADKRNWSSVYAATVVPEIDQIPTVVNKAEPVPKAKHASSKSKKTEPEEIEAESSASESDTPKVKLRPVHDIIHRINWDDELDPDDYLIGYIERFEGIAELPLADWKTEQTDEEFIPLHRIIYIRKTGDSGDLVWDRRSRLDSIFGSGIKKAGG
jgi:uncharacterized protein (UPF0248 family)